MRGGVCGLRPRPTPAVASKFSIVGGGNVSMSSTAGSRGGKRLGGVTPAVEVLAVVSVEETIAE